MLDANQTSSAMGLSLQDLCDLQPDDPELHIQLAKYLQKEGNDIASLYAAKKAYNILIRENPVKAAELIEQFGSEILSTSMRPLVSEIYLPLKDIFGSINLAYRRVKLNDGDALFWAGEKADYIYLLIQGELAINSEINGQLVFLNYLHPGALVGEAAMETGGKRMATVIANQDCQLIRFTPDELFQAFEKHDNLLPHFLKEMMVRKNACKLSNSPLFSQLPMDLRFIIANRIQVNHFKAGSILSTSSHENNDKASMIVHGIVHLYDESQTGSRIYCGRLSTGDMFDISPLLHDLPIGLLYIAETDCEVLHIDFNVIRDVMQISKNFRVQLEKDTSMLTAQLTRTVLLQHKS